MRKSYICDNLFGYPGGCCDITVESGTITSIELCDANRYTSTSDAGSEIVDLRGKCVLPGLVDSHAHLIGTAMMMITPSVRGVKSLDELVSVIEKSEPQRDKLNRFLGLDLADFPDRQAVNAGFLDSKFGDAAIMLKGVEGHSAVLNSAAFRMLNLKVETSGVELSEHGKPTGFITGDAYEDTVDVVYDSYTRDEKLRGLDMAVKAAISKGCAGIHCLEGYGNHRRREFEMMLEYSAECPVDLTLYPRIGPNPCEDDFAMIAELGLTRVGGCELVDGAIGSFSAAVFEPYKGRETCGVLFQTDEELESYYRNAFRYGLQPCVHVIGDRAIDQCLRALERIGNDGIDVARFRPRLDHFILANDDLINRAVAVGACAGVQPAFMHTWGARGGKYESVIGGERWGMLHRYGSMIERGMHIAAGSDSYITPINPLLQITAMTHHHNEVERVTFGQAVTASSESAAYIAFQEHTRGRIAVGYEATFSVVESLEPILSGGER